MDKAKAYDEALKRAKEQRDDYQKELNKTDKNSQLANILRAGISAVEMVFPQLKESDDERVRKDIIDHFELIKAGALYDNQEGSDNIISSCNEKIAYLKKQKECLTDNTSEDERMLRTIIRGFENLKGNGVETFNNTKIDDILVYLEKQKKPKVDIDKLRRDLYQSGYNDGYQHGKEDAQKEQKSIPNTYGCLNCTKLEECKKGLTPCSGHRLKIVDQKPADDKAFEEWIDCWFKEHKEKAYPQITMDEKEFKNFCRGIRNMYQQKSDWNEEDEMMRENIISDLQYFRDCATDEEAVSGYNDEIAWLKDIYLSLKKHNEAVDKLWSNEWSEEDEEIIYSLRSFLIQAEQSGRYGSIQIAQIEQCLNWLKSVHPIKQDWTEEDEEIWFALITFFKTYLQKYPPLCKDEKAQANRILEWLNTTIKSFRLHHRYKPTKEQMEALKNSAYGTYQNGDGPALRELYEQLLKLGVKEHN